MRILYIGTFSGTCLQRARALERLGHELVHVDVQGQLPKHWQLWLYRQGGTGLDLLARRILARAIPRDARFDLAHVDSGSVIGPRAIALLRRHAPVVTNYNADNPYVDPSPERKRWTIFRRAAPHYDLAVTIRRPGIEDMMRARGIRHPMTIWQTADEVVHAPVPEIPADRRADVCFAGTWMPGREDFMAELIEAGIDLAIYGPRWQKAPNHARLAPHVRAAYLEGRDYATAIAGAKIGLVILNARNGDLHTKRSVEIPMVGSVVCALRTPYHEELYEEDVEALFFDDARDCAAKCRALLDDPDRLARMAAAGRAKVETLGLRNELMLDRMLKAALGAAGPGGDAKEPAQ